MHRAAGHPRGWRTGALEATGSFDEQFAVSPSTTPGTRSAALFSHYSLLRTAEQLLGLPLLGKAASSANMAPAFGL